MDSSLAVSSLATNTVALGISQAKAAKDADLCVTVLSHGSQPCIQLSRPLNELQRCGCTIKNFGSLENSCCREKAEVDL